MKHGRGHDPDLQRQMFAQLNPETEQQGAAYSYLTKLLITFMLSIKCGSTDTQGQHQEEENKQAFPFKVATKCH